MAFKPVYVIDGSRTPFLKARTGPGPFSAGDLAVQVQAGRMFGDGTRPTEKPLRAMAEAWRPHRGVAALFLWHGAQQPAPWVVGLIVAATACRVLLVVGLFAYARMDRPNPVRFVGALGTYVTGLGLCGALFVG